MILNCILVLSLLFVTFFKTKRSLHMLQQNLYNENNRYIKWVVRNYKQFIDFDILSIIISVLCLVFFYKVHVVSMIGVLFIIAIDYYLGYKWIKRISNSK